MAEFKPELFEPIGAASGITPGAPAKFENISPEDKQKVIDLFGVTPIDQGQKTEAAFDPTKFEPIGGDQPDEETPYQRRRREYHELIRTSPEFKNKPASERAKMLFPDAKTEDARNVPLAPARGFWGSMRDEAAKGEAAIAEGVQGIINPKFSGRATAPWEVPEPIKAGLNIVGGTAQRVFAPVTGLFNEYVSRPLGNLARRLPIPNPESLGQQVEITSDIIGPAGMIKGAQAVKAPLAKALPTIKEKLSVLDAEKAQKLSSNQRLSEVLNREKDVRLGSLDDYANIGQTRAAELGNRVRESIPAKITNIEQRTAAEIAAERARLAAEQARVGESAARAMTPPAPTKARANFAKRYAQLEAQADQIRTTPTNLATRSGLVVREKGLQGVPTNPAERTGAGLSRTLLQGADPLEIEEDVRQQVRRMITEGGDVKKIDYAAITKSVLGPAVADDVTAGELLRTRKRLRAAERAAYDAGHKNLGRQFGDLQDAVTQDLKAADPRLARLAKKIDADYFRKKSAEWYTEGVEQAFHPATGAWDRKRFTKWFDNHSDASNNDRFLKQMLGDKYESTKSLVEDMQQASAVNIEQVSRQVVANLKKRAVGNIKEVQSEAGELLKEAKSAESRIISDKTKARAQIEKDIAERQKNLANEAKNIEAEINKKAVEIAGKPLSDRIGSWMGSIAIINGLENIATGRVATGVTKVLGGAVTLMTHGTMMKMLNSLHGQSLIRRAVRAAPGTGEAIAASTAIGNFAKQLASEPEAEGPFNAKEAMLDRAGRNRNAIDARLSREKPRLENADGSASSERTITIESDGKHYLIPTIVDGKRLSKEAAIKQWEVGNNKPVGIYDNAAQAKRAAEERTNSLGREMMGPAMKSYDAAGRPIASEAGQTRPFTFGINPPEDSPLAIPGNAPAQKKPASKRLKFDERGNLIPQ